MGGEGSGRHKEPTMLIKEAKAKDAQNLPQYFLRLSKLALDGDREALFYLIDRHLGKPKAVAELTGEGGEALGTGMITEIFKLVDKRRKDLEEPNQLPEAVTDEKERLGEV